MLELNKYDPASSAFNLQQSGALVEYSVSEMINLYYKKPYTDMKNSPYFDQYLFKIGAMIFYKNHHL